MSGHLNTFYLIIFDNYLQIDVRYDIMFKIKGCDIMNDNKLDTITNLFEGKEIRSI